jgi:glycosyltransferase involved in cell wall biosynthesis
MKIAITSLYLPSGSKIGVGYQVHYLANALIRRGHEVTVFSQCGQSAGAEYRTVKVPSGKRLRTFGFAWNLRHVDFGDFDVLNAHGDDWFLWGCRRPRLVHTFHGSCLAETLHARSAVAMLRMGALAACEYNSCLLADELVAVSENTRRYIPLVRKVIPCGVDTATFSPGGDRSGGEKSASPSILFVGTIHGRKRGAMLLDVFQREVRRAVAGAELWAVCEQKVEAPGVRWFGRIATDELAGLYRRAWVFCLPSTYEGFGVPYVEAMASGTAVVATPNVGAAEVTRGGRDGLLASEDQLGSALVRVLGDEALRGRLAAAGLERSRHFAWNSVCEQYEALYRGIATEPQQPVGAVR